MSRPLVWLTLLFWPMAAVRAQVSYPAPTAPPAVAAAAVWVEPDAPPLALRGWWPADALAGRMQSRNGAWYGLVYVPLAWGEWARVSLRLQQRGYQVRMTALDAWPEVLATQAQPLPTRASYERGAWLWHSAPIFRANPSAAQGLYVLVELWSRQAQVPTTAWVSASPLTAQVARPLHPRPLPPEPRPLAPDAPAGPLSQPRVGGAVGLPW